MPSITPISYLDLPGTSRLWQAVVSGSVPDGLYAAAPASVDACKKAAAGQLAAARPWPELAQILEESGRHYGVPQATLTRLRSLADGKAVAVVTGQQTGYLGGPLFTFLKAYHTTRLAADLEKDLGLPVLPVFWLEGEDHDFEEVRTASLLDQSGSVHELRFEPGQEIPGYEVGRYFVHAEAHLAELSGAIENPSESGLDVLRDAYRNHSLSDALGRLLARTLGPRGLLIVEGMNGRLKQMALPLWQRILKAGPALGQILSQRGEHLRAQGYAARLTPTPDSYLFYLSGQDHIRISMAYSGKLQYPGGRTTTVTPESIEQLIASGQVAISPKAALRPLYQDFVLPTVAYVGGPGELDYHAQLAPFYAELSVVAPSLFPRLSATLLDPRTAKAVDKLDLPLVRLLGEDKNLLLKGLLRDQDEGRTADRFDAARRSIEDQFDLLKRDVSEIDPTLEGPVHGAAGKTLHLLGELQQKTERALKQKHATVLARLEKTCTAIRPGGKFSERVFCSGYYLVKYGPDELLAALDALPVDGRAHQVLRMDA